MFNIFNMRKSASSKDIIMDFAKAWQTLNTKLIEKHLSSDFIYPLIPQHYYKIFFLST